MLRGCRKALTFLTKARVYVDVTSSVRASSPSRWVDLRDWGRRVSFAFSLIVCFHPTNFGRAVLPYFFPYFSYSNPQSRLPGFFLLDFLSLPMRSTLFLHVLPVRVCGLFLGSVNEELPIVFSRFLRKMCVTLSSVACCLSLVTYLLSLSVKLVRN